MADNKVSFLLDLDIKDFSEKGAKAEGMVKSIGSQSNLSGILNAFDSMLPLLAAGTLALEGMKKAVDWTLEGEELKRIDDQFNSLSKTAGISGEKLKEGLELAAKGLVDTDTLLKAANESMLKVGSASERLPELMTIATKASQVFGGTAEENFKILNQAVTEGNVGILKRYGLTVDLKAAERDFATQQGVTIDQLSELGKKQAIFNAAIDAGSKAFKDIQVDTDSAKNSLESLSVIVSDLKQTFIVAFEKIMGPKVREFLNVTKLMVQDLKKYFVSEYGEGVESANAKLDRAREKLAELNGEAARLQAQDLSFWEKLIPGRAESKLKDINSKIAAQTDEIKKLEAASVEAQKVEDENTEKKSTNIQKVSKENLIDKEKQAKQNAAFNAMLAKSDQELEKEREKNITDLADVEKMILAQRQEENTNYQIKKNQIAASLAIAPDQKKKLIAIEEQIHHQRQLSMERELDDTRKKLLDQYVKNSESAFKGIEKAFAANTKKMQMEQADFGKRGNEMWNSLSSNATSAFTQMGAAMAQGQDIGTAAAEALKAVFLGMLGDRAIAEGSILLLSSIWPPNPLGLGAGAGLIALGGALKSLAGAGAAPSTAVSSPSVQATASGAGPRLEPTTTATPGVPEPIPSMDQQQKQQRTVSIHIEGNYLETDQTKRMLMDLMRQETDATGFNYSQIGA